MTEEKIKIIGGIIGAIGTLLSIVVLVSGLPFCQRVFTISLIISAALAIYMHLKLLSIDISSDPLRGSVIRRRIKVAPVKVISEFVFIILMIASMIFILFPELSPISECGTSKLTAVPTPFPTPTFSLSNARVEFLITFSDGSSKEISDDEVLTLHPDDKVTIKVNVTTIEHLAFPHDLLFRFKPASGEESLGDIVAYVAREPGQDIVTVQITDQITGDQISRSMRVEIR